MNRSEIIILYIISSILGGLLGVGFAYKDVKIEKLTKENDDLKKEIIDYKWQIEQVPYVIENWCNGE